MTSRMSLCRMEGAWSDGHVLLFDTLIAGPAEPAYRRLVEPIAERLPAAVHYFRRIVAAQVVRAGELSALLREAGLTDVESRADDEMPAAWAVGRKPGGDPAEAS